MPYPTNAYLPPSVRCHLPEHAQDIYHEAFNHAYAAHTDEGVGRKGPRIGDDIARCLGMNCARRSVPTCSDLIV